MKKNVGGIDRIIRIVLGVVLIALYFLGYYPETFGVWSYVLLAVGVIALFTGVFTFCPAYLITGSNTCKVEE